MENLVGVTKSGFSYKVPKNNLNNYELIEVLAEMEENPLLFPKVLKMVLGKKQTEKLKNYLREKDGTISTEKMNAELEDIFEAQKRLKK